MNRLIKGSIVLIIILLGVVFFFDLLLEVLVTHPRSPYYVDFEDPQPLYETDSEIQFVEGHKLVIGLESRNINYYPIEDLPEELVQAFIAIEDSRFYRHRGYDPKGIVRALWVNFTHKEVRQGGSTITQQLARNLFLSHRRNLDRKILELSIALRLEELFSKEEIMEMYLNQVYFGNGNWGVDQAAKDYFDKSADELDLKEASLLAGMVQAPSVYAPVTSWDLAARRQRLVLQRMIELGFISKDDANEALIQEGAVQIRSHPTLICNEEDIRLDLKIGSLVTMTN